MSTSVAIRKPIYSFGVPDLGSSRVTLLEPAHSECLAPCARSGGLAGLEVKP